MELWRPDHWELHTCYWGLHSSDCPIRFLAMHIDRRLYATVVVVTLIGPLHACAVFRDELPQILYEVTFSKPPPTSLCNDVAAAVAIELSPARIDSPFPTRGPDMRCSAKLQYAMPEHDVVTLIGYSDDLAVNIQRFGQLGIATPTTLTIQFASAVVAVIRNKYPDADIRRKVVYRSPFGP